MSTSTSVVQRLRTAAPVDSENLSLLLVLPGLFFFLGVASDDPSKVFPNHSPYFYADERALPLGVKALASLTLDYMTAHSK